MDGAGGEGIAGFKTRDAVPHQGHQGRHDELVYLNVRQSVYRLGKGKLQF